MRRFLVPEQLDSLLTPAIVASLSAIHEYRGRQSAMQGLRPDALESLRQVALIQSTGASNRIEGIYTSDARLAGIVRERVAPRNRDEQEILGYRNVLALIHESHDLIPVSPGVILQLHRDLFAPTGLGFGGQWKDADNAIVQVNADGSTSLRFKPTSALETPAAVEGLCRSYAEALTAHRVDPLLLAAVFTFDFASIHPFNDGNGRMSRLLFLLLLYQAGHDAGKYISIERAIEESKQSYYETLRLSSVGWQDGANDYRPFVEYLLGVVTGAYRELDRRLSAMEGAGGNKAARVEEEICGTLGAFTKRDLLLKLPDISAVTVERVLKALLDAGRIEKMGAGRGTRYVLKR